MRWRTALVCLTAGLALAAPLTGAPRQTAAPTPAAVQSATPSTSIVGTWIFVSVANGRSYAQTPGSTTKVYTVDHAWYMTQAPGANAVQTRHSGHYTLDGDQYKEVVEYANAGTIDLITSAIERTGKAVVTGDTLVLTYSTGSVEAWRRAPQMTPTAGASSPASASGSGQLIPAGEFGAGAYRPGGLISLPRVIKQVRPNYTPQGIGNHLQGAVTLDVVVLPDGSVGDVRVVRSLDANKYGLDYEGIKAARGWRFSPAFKDGQPVAVVVQLELSFNLNAGKPPAGH